MLLPAEMSLNLRPAALFPTCTATPLTPAALFVLLHLPAASLMPAVKGTSEYLSRFLPHVFSC